MIENEYIKVCNIGLVEFGYYCNPDGGCVDEYKAVAIYWDRENGFLDEVILSCEDSPGEAIETIAEFVRKGVSFSNCYNEHFYRGGYRLVYQDEKYVPVTLDQYLDIQVDNLLSKGSVTDEILFINAIQSRVNHIYQNDDNENSKKLPALNKELLQNRTYSLSISWD